MSFSNALQITRARSNSVPAKDATAQSTVSAATPADLRSKRTRASPKRADRVRVEFDNGDDDYRIEVRISDDDNSVRVDIG